MRNKEWFKNELDQSISGEKVFTDKDKHKILHASAHSTQPLVKRKSMLITALSFVLLVGFSTVMFLSILNDEKNPPPANNAENGLPNDTVNQNENPNYSQQRKRLIDERMTFIEEHFRVGMTEVEVLELLGETHYEKIINDSEDGTHYDIKYQDFLQTPFTQRADGTQIDIDNIKNGNIGLQIFVGMTWDKKAQRISLVYLDEEGRVMMRFITEGKMENLAVES